VWVFRDGMIADIGRGFRVHQQARMVWASEGRDSFYMVRRLWHETNGTGASAATAVVREG
jgi:hypothetical protein